MTDSTVAPRQTRPAASETRTCILLLVIGFALCFAAVKSYRSQGQQPRFYQENLVRP